MTILEAIKSMPEQLKYQPEIQNPENFKLHEKFIVAGMGGSNLASGLLKIWDKNLDIIIHRDYGLPAMIESELKNYLVIASSYSGNTEETIDAFETAIKNKLSVITISTGGKLLERAKETKSPYIQLPDMQTQPRLALGLSLKAMLKAMGDDETAEHFGEIGELLNADDFEKEGKEVAQKLIGKIPVIYSSATNAPLVYIWKIMFNENVKIPAFVGAFPEANHNDMNGFDSSEIGKPLSDNLHLIFLKDAADDKRIQKRMDLAKKRYEERGLAVEVVNLPESSVLEKIFRGFFLSEWITYYLAEEYKIDPEKVQMVEEFKKEMAGK